MKRIFLVVAVVALLMLVTCQCQMPAKTRVSFEPEQEALGEANKIIFVDLQGEVNDSWIGVLKEAFENAKGNPVLIHMESGGGSVEVSVALKDYLKEFKKKSGSKVYVYSQYGIYSGAYYAMLPVDEIYVSPAGGTGSIGVVYLLQELPKENPKTGEKFHIFKSGKMKWIGVADSVTGEQEAYLQEKVNALYTDFLVSIAVERSKVWWDRFSMTSYFAFAYLLTICDGRTYSSADAYDLGLIDGVLYIPALMEKIKTDYGMSGKVKVEIYAAKYRK